MKTNDKRQLHSQSVEELNTQLQQAIRDLAKARLEKKAGKLENTRLSLLSDKVAVLKTIMRERQLVESVEGPTAASAAE